MFWFGWVVKRVIYVMFSLIYDDVCVMSEYMKFWRKIYDEVCMGNLVLFLYVLNKFKFDLVYLKFWFVNLNFLLSYNFVFSNLLGMESYFVLNVILFVGYYV